MTHFAIGSIAAPDQRRTHTHTNRSNAIGILERDAGRGIGMPFYRLTVKRAREYPPGARIKSPNDVVMMMMMMKLNENTNQNTKQLGVFGPGQCVARVRRLCTQPNQAYHISALSLFFMHFCYVDVFFTAFISDVWPREEGRAAHCRIAIVLLYRWIECPD